MITQFYRLCMQLSRGISFYPSFLEIVFSKKIICFLKTRLFKKHHLFNNLNQQSMYIFHNQIVLYISQTICIRKSLLPLVSKNIDLRICPFFITKHDLKMHLFNQSNGKSVHILCILHVIVKRNNLVPIILKNHNF